MRNEAKDKILSKIAKIMELAGRGDPGEAENAATKAQELLLKFNLTEQDVSGFAQRQEIGLIHKTFDLGKVWKRNEGKWLFSLYSSVSQFNLCKTIYRASKNCNSVYLIGTEMNVELVAFMVDQLIPRLRTIEKNQWHLYHGYDKRNTFRRAFLMGAVQGIFMQLQKQAERFIAYEDRAHALIILNKKLIDEYTRRQWNNLRDAKSSRYSSYEGAKRGRKVGQNISLHKGIQGVKNGNASYGGQLNASNL